MHKHSLHYHDQEGESIGQHKTDCRLTIGQMFDHGRAIAKVKFPRARTFLIYREDGQGKPLVKVAGPFKCNSQERF